MIDSAGNEETGDPEDPVHENHTCDDADDDLLPAMLIGIQRIRHARKKPAGKTVGKGLHFPVDQEFFQFSVLKDDSCGGESSRTARDQEPDQRGHQFIFRIHIAETEWEHDQCDQENADHSGVSMNDYGETTTLDNQRNPVTSILLDIITKISQRNSYTQEEKETFFATHVGDVTVAGTQWQEAYSSDQDILPLETVFYEIAENASFLPSLLSTPVRFNFIVSGQVLQVEMVYNELLHVWKGEIRDAIGQPVLENMTMMAGANNIEGLHLKYNRLNEAANIVTEDLVLAGLYVTEPLGQDRNVSERGLESSQYAFTETKDGTSPCYVCYFENQIASDVYKEYMNGERVDQHQSYDELGDYTIG